MEFLKAFEELFLLPERGAISVMADRDSYRHGVGCNLYLRLVFFVRHSVLEGELSASWSYLLGFAWIAGLEVIPDLFILFADGNCIPTCVF